VRAELRDSGEQGHILAWLRGRTFSRFPGKRVRPKDRGATIFFSACLILIALVVAAVPLISHSPRISGGTMLPQALANPQITAGQPGGLMPDVQVSIRGRDVGLRDLRPAMLVVLQSGCACDDAVRNAVNEASARGASVYLVDAPGTAAPQAVLLADHLGYAAALEQPNALLAQLFGGTGARAVFVNANGLIVGQPITLSPTTRLETWMDRLST
jgi:hypothetical protein